MAMGQKRVPFFLSTDLLIYFRGLFFILTSFHLGACALYSQRGGSELQSCFQEASIAAGW